MIGLYGHASAREHMCFQRLGEECGNDLRFYQIGDNPIISRDARSVQVAKSDPKGVAKKIREDGVELLLVTDTFLLQTDAVDACSAEGIRVLAPSRHAAKLEDHKSLTKRLLIKAGVPTPESWLVTTAEEAKAILRRNWSDSHKYVVKVDSLISDAIHRAMVPETLQESEQDVDEELAALLLAHREGGLLIERRVEGFETSVHILWDGSSYVLCPPVRDYKRVSDGDTGPNTYGAASIACGGGFSAELEQQLREQIIEPTLNELLRSGYDYRGFIYFGVMLLDDGPVLLEINVRPGNPEFIAILGLLRSGFRDLIESTAAGTLHNSRVDWHRESFCGTVFAMGKGYPQTMTPEPTPITGLEHAISIGNVVVEDIACKADGTLVVSGGRVVAPFAVAPGIKQVRDAVHATLSSIQFEGKHHRSDLGFGLDPRLFATQ